MLIIYHPPLVELAGSAAAKLRANLVRDVAALNNRKGMVISALVGRYCCQRFIRQ